MEPAVSSTPVTLPSQYLRKGFEDSINLESPPRLNLDAILQAANDGACCTEDNLHSFAAYLNQELITIGFAPVVKDGGSSATCDTVQMLNCVYDLLQQHHQHIQRREDMASSLRRAQSDVKVLREAMARLKEELEMSQREVAAWTEKDRQSTKKIKSLSAKLRAEQEEVKRLKLSMQHRETQFIHDTRKKEREYNRLKERLGQLVSDKSQERRLGMQMLNALQRGDGRRAQWRLPGGGTGKHNEELYSVIVSNYEERQKELMAENASLRESLVMMQKELVAVLNEKSAELSLLSQDPAMDHSPTTTGQPEQDELLSSGHFQMPYNIVRDGIERSIQMKCQKVKERVNFLQKRAASECECKSDVEDVEQSEANTLGKNHIAENLHNAASEEGKGVRSGLDFAGSADLEPAYECRSSSLLSESWLAEEADLLQLQREHVKSREVHLEEREKKYLEVVAQLDRDRQEFEQQRMDFFRDQFLDASIFSTSFLSASSHGKDYTPPSRCTPHMGKRTSSGRAVPSTLASSQSGSPDLKHVRGPGASTRVGQSVGYRSSPSLHECRQAVTYSFSSPVVKKLHPTRVSSSLPPHHKERPPAEDHMDLTCPLTLSPEKQQGKVLNECTSPPPLGGEGRRLKHRSILAHSQEVKRALEKQQGSNPLS